jgi:16S rRNA (cytidine1402-2'-O)-methyltransferase
LNEVEVIACEDTRHTRKLLNHYGINTATISYHEHNEKERAKKLTEQLLRGSNVAVVSDAGTPGINDPGYRVVKLAIEAGITVVPIPGPVALIGALIVSGFPTDDFFFGGFLPAKSGQRKTRLSELRSLETTLIFYEAPHRIVDTLHDVLEILGDREAVVARELTKLHETVERGRLSQLLEHFSSGSAVRGEIVLLIDRNVIQQPRLESDELIKLVAEWQAEGLDERAALKRAAKKLGLTRDDAYRQLMRKRQR